jgi:hypothetical protein
MGTRVKLVAFLLGALATTLPLVFLVAVPESPPPGMVERIDLRAPRGSEHGFSGSAHAATPGRPRQRYGQSDGRAGVTARRGEDARGRPTPASISTGDGTRAHPTAPGRLPAADPPIPGPRGDSVPSRGGPPTPRGTPVSGTSPVPRASPPEGDQPLEPPEPADPPDEPATSAAVDPPEEPEPADGDPADEPQPADSDLLP